MYDREPIDIALMDVTVRTREIEVLEFLPVSQIDPLMYDRSYFLEPEGSRRSRMCCWPRH
jgi:non-homologous end joining protein Ku